MPRGTTLRNVRVAEPLWSAARAVAEQREEEDGLSGVIRAALERYVKRHGAAAGVTMPPPETR